MPWYVSSMQEFVTLKSLLVTAVIKLIICWVQLPLKLKMKYASVILVNSSYSCITERFSKIAIAHTYYTKLLNESWNSRTWFWRRSVENIKILVKIIQCTVEGNITFFTLRKFALLKNPRNVSWLGDLWIATPWLFTSRLATWEPFS